MPVLPPFQGFIQNFFQKNRSGLAHFWKKNILARYLRNTKKEFDLWEKGAADIPRG